MSCNGCRVLRKGCSDSCVLRSSLQWIESAEAQGHATVFVAKFFGRAGMLSFINAVAESQRPALFQSLLYEACGRTVNPVFGAVGLLWSGNWATCQAAVETVLKGGSLKPEACPPSADIPHKSFGNPPLKRPHSLTEPNRSPNAEARRERSSNFQREPPEFEGDAHTGLAMCTELVCFPNSDTNISRKPEILGTPEAPNQAQMRRPCPQVVVPVARRVKPPATYGLASKLVARDHGHQLASPAQQDHRAIELDLSLNSQAFANANGMMIERHADGNEKTSAQNDVESHADRITLENSTCHDEGHASCVEVGRPSSPCSFSINSEGSVASVDTTDFSISGVQNFIARQLRQEDCHLLHLL